MLAFPGLIAPAAEQAGIKLPKDVEDYNKTEYPHWFVFCQMQLGAPMPDPSAQWDNAKVVAAIPNDQITKVTPKQLEEVGFRIGFSK